MDVCVCVCVYACACVMYATYCNQYPGHSFYTHSLQHHLPHPIPSRIKPPCPYPSCDDEGYG